MQLAALKGYRDIVTCFLEAGDLNTQNNYADHTAAWKGVSDLNTRPEVTLQLHEAASGGHRDDVLTLLEAGGSPNKQDNDGRTALHRASNGGHGDIVVSLLEAGGNPNIQDNYGRTALHRASSGGHRGVVVALLGGGGDPNIQNKEGETALQVAVKFGYRDIERTLLEAGCDPNTQDDAGNTALHTAGRKGHTDTVVTLLDAGCDPNIQNNKGLTALHGAAREAHRDTVITLLEGGADPFIKDNFGEKPIQFSVLKDLDPREFLQKDYDKKVSYNSMISIALYQGQHDLVFEFLERVGDFDTKVKLLINKGPGEISNVLDFLAKMLEKYENNEKKERNKEDFQRTKEILGIETKRGEYTLTFYLMKCEVLGGRSLLEYIDSQGVRMFKQREELIDLAVKIANLNHGEGGSRAAMQEVIKHFKTGLESGEGLGDMIELTRERFPWSSSKMILMILISFLTCLFGIGLFVLDLTTDYQFSLGFLHKSVSRKSNQDSRIFPNISEFPSCSCLQQCLDDQRAGLDDTNNTAIRTSKADYEMSGLFLLWHCIMPLVLTIFILLSIDFSQHFKRFKATRLFYISCFLPIPVFTDIYRFILDVRYHLARSRHNFRTNIEDIEMKIRKYEALGKL